MLTKQQIDSVRGLAGRVGVTEAAKMLGVHRTSLLSLLSGAVEIRPNTESQIRHSLDGGAIEASGRGETKANAPSTKRKA